MSENNLGYLGIDVGSISTNVVVIEPGGEMLYKKYVRGSGDPIRSVQESIGEKMWQGVQIGGVCVTGSGRSLIGVVVGADVVKNEIMTHARAALHFHPDVQTVFEIGGQDSKVMIIRDGVVVDFAMNLVCAAGTGSFLDSQAKRLNITIEEMSKCAMLSSNPVNIAGRCTVFAESDMIHRQQMGYKQNDIIMGLCNAMVRNYLSNVCRGKEIKPPIVLQGGVSANKGIRRAFQEALDTEMIIPEHNMVMGAYGAALTARYAGIDGTRFRGREIAEHNVRTRTFMCGDCPNRCEIIDIVEDGEIIGKSGGRCRKWENHKYMK